MTNTIDIDAARKLANYKGDDAVQTGNYATGFPSVNDDVSPQEWQARVDLAACYRLVDLYGMSDLTYNHITVRVPGTDTFLINLCQRRRLRHPQRRARRTRGHRRGHPHAQHRRHGGGLDEVRAAAAEPALLDLLADWVPDPAVREAVLTRNAHCLYGFSVAGAAA